MERIPGDAVPDFKTFSGRFGAKLCNNAGNLMPESERYFPPEYVFHEVRIGAANRAIGNFFLTTEHPPAPEAASVYP